MANRTSEGIIQVHDNSISSINDALYQVTNRLDHMKGLRGRTLTYDRIRANAALTADDVLTRGALSVVSQLQFIVPPNAVVAPNPGAFLHEFNTGLRRSYNFSSGNVTSARLLFSGWATFSGTKRIRIINSGFFLAEVIWTGTGETLREGEPKVFTEGEITSLINDPTLRVVSQMSDPEESLVINWLALELNG